MKKIYTEESVADIADAIREKNGTNNTYKTSEMAAAIENLQGERTIVNGVIEQYKASTSTVVADTFVEFVNNITSDISTGSSILVCGGGTYDTYTSAVLLEDDKVFVTCSNSAKLYGAIVAVSDNTVTLESLTQISSNSNSGDYAQAVALSPTSVFVAFRYGSVSRAVVCTISGTTITTGTEVRIGSNYSMLSVVKLSGTSVFVAAGADPTAVVCTISGTTITPGTEVTLDDGYYVTSDAAYSRHSVVAISSSLVFVAYRKSGNSAYESLSAMICSISGDVITVGTITTVTTDNVENVWACALTSSTILLVYRDVSNTSIYGAICTISGTTISAETPTSILSYNGTVYAVIPLDSSLACIFCNTGSSPVAVACTISGSTITAGDTVAISASNAMYMVGALALSPSKIFVSMAPKYGTRAEIVYGGIAVQASQTGIDGLTKTQCTTSTAGDVWVLNTDESD